MNASTAPVINSQATTPSVYGTLLSPVNPSAQTCTANNAANTKKGNDSDTMDFVVVPKSLLLDPRLTADEKLQLLSITIHSRPYRPTAWPSRERIASMTGGVSVDTVDRRNKKIEAAGYMSVSRKRASKKSGKRAVNLYDVSPVWSALPARDFYLSSRDHAANDAKNKTSIPSPSQSESPETKPHQLAAGSIDGGYVLEAETGRVPVETPDQKPKAPVLVFDRYTEKEREAIAALEKETVDPVGAVMLVKKYGAEECMRHIVHIPDYAANRGGYLRAAITTNRRYQSSEIKTGPTPPVQWRPMEREVDNQPIPATTMPVQTPDGQKAITAPVAPPPAPISPHQAKLRQLIAGKENADPEAEFVALHPREQRKLEVKGEQIGKTAFEMFLLKVKPACLPTATTPPVQRKSLRANEAGSIQQNPVETPVLESEKTCAGSSHSQNKGGSVSGSGLESGSNPSSTPGSFQASEEPSQSICAYLAVDPLTNAPLFHVDDIDDELTDPWQGDDYEEYDHV